MSLESQIDDIDALDLREWAEEFIVKLRSYVDQNPSSQVAERYSTALQEVQSVKIEPLQDQAFEIRSRTLVLNAIPLATIFELVKDDIDDPDVELAPSEFLPFCRAIVAIFLFHELRHIDQGVGEYEQVKELKSLGLAPLVADLDLLADRDAVVVFADLFADQFEGWMDAYIFALSLSPQYFFRAFSFDPEKKPHKTLRAASLILMLARALRFGDDVPEGSPAIDATLTFYGLEGTVFEQGKPFVIMAEQPNKQIYCIADPQWQNALVEIVLSIENGDFMRAVGKALEIVGEKEI